MIVGFVLDIARAVSRPDFVGKIPESANWSLTDAKDVTNVTHNERSAR